MIISSATASSTVPASPETLPASGGTDAGAGGAFASLLPPDNDCQARASSDGGKAESEDDTDDDGKPDDAEPVLAEQTNLAALLYALPAIPVPPPAGVADATESLQGQDRPFQGPESGQRGRPMPGYSRILPCHPPRAGARRPILSRASSTGNVVVMPKQRLKMCRRLPQTHRTQANPRSPTARRLL